jgi:hypothetical protein
MMQETMIAAQRQGSHSQSCRNTENWVKMSFAATVAR